MKILRPEEKDLIKKIGSSGTFIDHSAGTNYLSSLYYIGYTGQSRHWNYLVVHICPIRGQHVDLADFDSDLHSCKKE